ncbi:hypothetical protein KR093_003499 [Drosophila rubida]|uniref:Uncharacterized protein n=1 Tax=Drosophila rubida TaxID=30044 RepID=A0AAD4JSN5_9MUSC|nr:hypothetical protein KR093_003499 [Drosophila rubida]
MRSCFYLLLVCLLLLPAEGHNESSKSDGVLRLTIHKVLPGDAFYRIFNGDATAARRFTNDLWRRVLAQYDTISI